MNILLQLDMIKLLRLQDVPPKDRTVSVSVVENSQNTETQKTAKFDNSTKNYFAFTIGEKMFFSKKINL